MKPAVVICFCLLMAGAGSAFVPLRTSGGKDELWDLTTAQPNVIGGKITYYIHPAVAVDIEAQEVYQAIRDGIHAWETEDTVLRFQEDPTRPAESDKAGDRINFIAWSNSLGPFTLATTYPTFENGHLRDADLLLNSESFIWSTQSPGKPGRADIQSVVCHEWGHAIGLDHIGIASATMFFSAALSSVHFRSLHPDDEAAVAAFYPAPSAALRRGSIEGVADVVDSSNDRAVHVVAINAQTGEVAASRLSEPEGAYRLEGVPEGTYRLVAVPFYLLSTLNPYWKSATREYLPLPLTETGTAPGPTRLVTVTAGAATTGVNFTLTDAVAPHEPNDTELDATPISVGDSLAARIERADDRDYYRFAATAGQTLSLFVHAEQIGAELDPTLDLFDRNGRTLIATSTDIRSVAAFGNRPDGVDRDCRILGWTAPADGEYYARVRIAVDSESGRNSSSYVLVIVAGHDAADALLSTYTSDPTSLPADGVSKSRVRIVPRNTLGDTLGAGVEVVLKNTGIGVVGGVVHEGGGVYGADVTAADQAGSAVLTVEMTTADGTTTVPAALTIAFLGPPSPTRSRMFADPTRIPFDGESTATITVEPRDAAGHNLGAGLEVEVEFDGPPAGSLGAIIDAGDGLYHATLMAGDEEAVAILGATVEGVPLAVRATVTLGFGLIDVIEEAIVETGELLLSPEVPLPSQKRLERALVRLQDARTTAPVNLGGAIKLVSKAIKEFEKAEKKGKGLLLFDSAPPDLTRALRQTAREELDAVDPSSNPKIGKKLAAAERQFEKGDLSLEVGAHGKSAKLYRKAYRKANHLHE